MPSSFNLYVRMYVCTYVYVCFCVVWKKFRSDDLLPLQLRETDNAAYERWLMPSQFGLLSMLTKDLSGI